MNGHVVWEQGILGPYGPQRGRWLDEKPREGQVARTDRNSIFRDAGGKRHCLLRAEQPFPHPFAQLIWETEAEEKLLNFLTGRMTFL